MANTKAAHLEAYNINRLLRNATPDSLQIQQDKSTGEQIISARMRQYSMEINEEEMTTEQIQDALNSLKSDLKNSSNAYVRFRFQCSKVK